MKLAVITTMWKRHELTDYVFGYYSLLKKKLSKEVELELIAAGSEGNISRRIADKHGWHYIETINRPLSRKHDKVLKTAKKFNPDGVVLIGSDDIISDTVFLHYKHYLQDGNTEPMGFRDAYLMWHDYTGYWSGYINHRAGESIGGGRMYPRECLDLLKWSLWGDEHQDVGLDKLVTDKLNANNIPVKVFGLRKVKGHGYVVGIQSRVGITQGLKKDLTMPAIINVKYFDKTKVKKILKNELQ